VKKRYSELYYVIHTCTDLYPKLKFHSNFFIKILHETIDSHNNLFLDMPHLYHNMYMASLVILDEKVWTSSSLMNKK